MKYKTGKVTIINGKEIFFDEQTIYVSDITIQVTDLQRSIQFYQDFLGFRIMRKTDNKAVLSADSKKALITLEQPEGVVSKQRRTTGSIILLFFCRNEKTWQYF